MAWIESHQTLATHRKTLLLQDLLRLKTPQVIGHLHLLWWWALDNAPRGDLSDISDAVIARAAQWTGKPGVFVEALIACQFIDTPSRCLHDWGDYTGRLVAKREANTARMRAQRASHVQRTTSAQPAHVQGLQDPTVQDPTVQDQAAAPPNPQEQPLAAVPTAAATARDSLGEIATIYEQNFGMLNQLIGDKLKDMLAEYGETLTRDALTEAGTQPANKRHLNYVAAILKRWAAEGRGPPGNNGHGQQPPKGKTRVPARYTRPEELDEDGITTSDGGSTARDRAPPVAG